MVSLMAHKKDKMLKKQQGNILVMFTIGLFALIGMAALALDGGHLLLNKSRLQNVADAAALHAAKVMDEGGSHLDARKAAVEIIALNLAHGDKFEINDALPLPSLDNVSNSIDITAALQVDFSMRPDPFESSTDEAAHYVKVEISSLNLNNFLAGIFNFDKRVTATALAGKSTAVIDCPPDLLPMLVCAADPSDNDDPGDGDPDTIFGLPINELYLMKMGSNNASPIGPGNFQLIRLGDNTGAADIRSSMAGEGYSSDNNCAFTDENNNIPTEPGNTVGPSGQGINTRLGIYQGPVNAIDHPRDVNICQGSEVTLTADGEIDLATAAGAYRYLKDPTDPLLSQYKIDNDTIINGNCPAPFSGNIETNSSTQLERRILTVVIGDCTDKNHGASDIPYLGLGCFFLTQEMVSAGQDAYIVGEFIEGCGSEGVPEGVAEDNPGPYKMVLYHVPGSKDS